MFAVMKAQKGSSFAVVQVFPPHTPPTAAASRFLTEARLATPGIRRLEQLRVRVFLTVPWVVWRPTLVSGALS